MHNTISSSLVFLSFFVSYFLLLWQVGRSTDSEIEKHIARREQARRKCESILRDLMDPPPLDSHTAYGPEFFLRVYESWRFDLRQELITADWTLKDLCVSEAWLDLTRPVVVPQSPRQKMEMGVFEGRSKSHILLA